MPLSHLFIMPEVPVPERPGTYLLCLEPRFRHAGHYLGSAVNLANRLKVHAAGNGANLIKQALDAGCKVTVVRIWVTETDKGAKLFEASTRHHGGNSPRSTKGRHGAKNSLVPLCPRHNHRGTAATNRPGPAGTIQWLEGRPAPDGWVPWADQDEEPPF
jgi:hypothetical protein